jgi:hypothetical protein
MCPGFRGLRGWPRVPWSRATRTSSGGDGSLRSTGGRSAWCSSPRATARPVGPHSARHTPAKFVLGRDAGQPGPSGRVRRQRRPGVTNDDRARLRGYANREGGASAGVPRRTLRLKPRVGQARVGHPRPQPACADRLIPHAVPTVLVMADLGRPKLVVSGVRDRLRVAVASTDGDVSETWSGRGC